jgi:hypothetical protein
MTFQRSTDARTPGAPAAAPTDAAATGAPDGAPAATPAGAPTPGTRRTDTRPAASRAAGAPEKPPLAVGRALLGLAGCVLRTAILLLQRRIHLPRHHAGRQLAFADGSRAVVYRETTVDRSDPRDPAVLVVGFRLRLLRGRAHRLFRVESILNTPLFVGFPGYASKLWLTHDENGLYRGIYQWDGARPAQTYARTLWRVLALGSVPGSIHYRVLPGVRRDEFLRDPGAFGVEPSDRARPEPTAPPTRPDLPAPSGRHRAPPAATPTSPSPHTAGPPGPARPPHPEPAPQAQNTAPPADWWRPAEPISATHRWPEPR